MTDQIRTPQQRPAPAVPLGAFVELASMSLADADPQRALEKVVRVARTSVRGARAVSITMLRDGRASTAASGDSVAYDLDQSQYRHNAGPCLDAGSGGEVQHIDDMRAETRWPAFAADAAAAGVLSSLSVPLPAQGSVTGALNVYGTTRSAFDDDAIAVATAIASYAAVSLFNVRAFTSALHEAASIKQAMEHRAVIEQSKGILMCRHECTAAEAFELLVRQSQTRNVKLRAVAEEVVASTLPAGWHAT
jgi:GAF domain-containing protein